MSSTLYWQDAFATQSVYAAWVMRPYKKAVFMMVKDSRGRKHKPTPGKPETLLPQAVALAHAERSADAMLLGMVLNEGWARYRNDQLPAEQRSQFCRSLLPERKHPSYGTAIALGAPLADETRIGAVLFRDPYIPVSREEYDPAAPRILRDDTLEAIRNLGSVAEKVLFSRVAVFFLYQGWEALTLHALAPPPHIRLILDHFFYRDDDLLAPDKFCELRLLDAADIATAIGAGLPATNPFGVPIRPCPTGEPQQLTMQWRDHK